MVSINCFPLVLACCTYSLKLLALLYFRLRYLNKGKPYCSTSRKIPFNSPSFVILVAISTLFRIGPQSSYQSTLPGVTLNLIKLSVNFSKLVAFKSSIALLTPSYWRYIFEKAIDSRYLSWLLYLTCRTTPLKGFFSISDILFFTNSVSGISHPNSITLLSFFCFSDRELVSPVKKREGSKMDRIIEVLMKTLIGFSSYISNLYTHDSLITLPHLSGRLRIFRAI